MLVSGSYEFDFLDHFMELDISREIQPSRSFDLLLCDASGIDMPVRSLYRTLKSQFKSSKEKILLVDKPYANRFIQAKLFQPATGDIATLISGDTVALAI